MPNAKLCKAMIDKVPYTEDGQLLVWDTELKGFGLCINKTCKSFLVQHDINGRTTRVHIGKYGLYTPDQARKTAREYLLMMAQGTHPKKALQEQKTKNMTLEELTEEFLKTRPLKKPTKKWYHDNMNRYLSDWMNKPVAQITEAKVQKRYAQLGRNTGHSTANAVQRILSSILGYGIAAHKLLDKNPVRILSETKSLFPPRRRRSYIKQHQLPMWWNGVNNLESDTMRDYLRLVLMTGLRRMEAARLEWEHVDLKDRTITIPDTKNGHPLLLPLSDFLHDMLVWRYKKYSGQQYVFPGKNNKSHMIEPKKAVYRVTRDTGIQFTIHDLRRTFLTIAESLDISTYALKRLVNHKITNDITGGYIIVDVERLRKPAEKIANYILKEVRNG